MICNKHNVLNNPHHEMRLKCFWSVLTGLVMLTFAQMGHGLEQTGSAEGEAFGKAVLALSAVYAAANKDAKSPECKSGNWQIYDIHRLLAGEVARLKPEYTYGSTAEQVESMVNSLVTAPYKVQNGTTLVEMTCSHAHKGADNYINALKDLAPLTRCGVLPGFYENWIKNLQERMRPYQRNTSKNPMR